MQTNRLARLRRLTRLLCALLIATALGPSPANAGGTVGNGTPASCTRTAFNAALVGGGVVVFACGGNPHTITLTVVKQISIDTIIDGGNDKITLKALGTHHFKVLHGKRLGLLSLSLTDGADTSGGAIENLGTTDASLVTFANNTATDRGGAIANHGTLRVSGSTFSKNKATNGGGAIWNDGGTVDVDASGFDQNQTTGGINSEGGAIGNAVGTLIVVKSTFTDNSAGNGGALVNKATATMVLSTFSGNEATNAGGAIYSANNNLTMDRCTLNGNQAGSGGGIAHFGRSLLLTASTLTGNSAISDGGGIYASGNATYTNSTLSGNQAGNGGGGLFQNRGEAVMLFTTVANNFAGFGAGVYKEGSVPGSLSLQNTLLSKNADGDCDGVLTSLGHNLSSDTHCGSAFTQPGDRIGIDPMLGPLANNGGPTMTHMLLVGSPAIDAAVMVAGLTTDQRGVKRPQGANPDIGSVEAP